MTKTVKQITKIRLKDDGLKGLEVTYMHPQEKDNLIWNNEHIEKRKHPIHNDLESSINDLRNFMLELCGYYNETISVMHKDYLIDETKITELVINGSDSFKISGEMRTLGDKFIKISTPDVEVSDGYSHFDTVVKVIAKIVEETHEYISGKKKLDEAEFLKKFAKLKNDDVLIKEFKDMSNKEKRDKCTEILEKMGAVVLINDELEIDDVDVQLNIQEVEVEAIEPVVLDVKEESEPLEIPLTPPAFKAPAF
ncbi:MAG: hypothetical protein RIR01_1879 [Bacteroidota bacterium]